MKLELMTCLWALLFALSLACGGSGDVHMPLRDVPTPGPISTDGPIWVAERLNGNRVIRGTVLNLVHYSGLRWRLRRV